MVVGRIEGLSCLINLRNIPSLYLWVQSLQVLHIRSSGSYAELKLHLFCENCYLRVRVAVKFYENFCMGTGSSPMSLL